MGSEAAALVVEALRCTYDGRGGVIDVSFVARAGQVTALLGPNGAGKTTSLLALVRELPVERGHVKRPATHPRIALVEDRADLYPELTVQEHLTFWALAHRVADPETAVAAALAAVDLEGQADSLGGQLSRGQRQRAVLASHVMIEPDVVLFDEPTIALDPPGVAWLEAWIQDRANSGSIVIVSSHDIDFVGRIADRVVVLDAGRTTDTYDIAEHGEPLRARLLSAYGTG